MARPTTAAAIAPQAITVTQRDLADIYLELIPRVMCSSARKREMRCKRGRACAYITLARDSPERKRAMARLRNSARSDGSNNSSVLLVLVVVHLWIFVNMAHIWTIED